MGYTTSTIYQTDDRIILDIRRLSIFFWKKSRFWRMGRYEMYGCLRILIGPIEIVLHEVKREAV